MMYSEPRLLSATIRTARRLLVIGLPRCWPEVIGISMNAFLTRTSFRAVGDLVGNVLRPVFGVRRSERSDRTTLVSPSPKRRDDERGYGHGLLRPGLDATS
jgi:hypothetical protein